MASSPSPLEHAQAAIRDSRPPVTDDLTYLTIVQSHLSPEVLPALNDVLQDVELTQRIGWDLVHMLLPLPGSAPCLKTVARLGNPREVILQVTEALRLLVLDKPEEEEDNEAKEEKTAETEDAKKTETTEKIQEAEPTRDALVASPTPAETPEPTEVDKFCLLVSMLATLHPRIKTKYPSRFLSASLMAILSSYRPSSQATHAITAFAQTLSGNKRPPLPTRKSSLSIQNLTIASDEKDEKAPDPEAAAEDPKEEAIQKKLVQSFVTHIIELYVKDNSLDWSARLQEHFAPDKIVPGKKNFGEAFREDLELQEREVLLGKLVV
jgi:outer membrane biosynthesis protein TonB